MNYYKVIEEPYSNDVEIDDSGRVVYLRDFMPGDVIEIPRHMLWRIVRQDCRMGGGAGGG